MIRKGLFSAETLIADDDLYLVSVTRRGSMLYPGLEYVYYARDFELIGSIERTKEQQEKVRSRVHLSHLNKSSEYEWEMSAFYIRCKALKERAMGVMQRMQKKDIEDVFLSLASNHINDYLKSLGHGL